MADLGAQYLTVKPHVSDATIHDELLAAGLLEPMDPAAVQGSPDPDHASKTHYVAPQGFSSLAKHFLPAACDLELARRVVAVDRDPDGRVAVVTEDGATHSGFDAVVLTQPVPQLLDVLDARPWSTDLLARQDGLRSRLSAVTYSSRFALAVHWDDEPVVRDAIATLRSPVGAIAHYVKSDSGALRYVSVESAKHTPTSATGVHSLLLHSSVPFGLKHGHLSTEDRYGEVLPAMLDALKTAFPGFADVPPPVSRKLLFWKFSQVHESSFGSGAKVATADAAAVALPGPDATAVVLAGDAFAGESGIDASLLSGRDAAAAVMRLIRGSGSDDGFSAGAGAGAGAAAAL